MRKIIFIIVILLVFVFSLSARNTEEILNMAEEAYRAGNELLGNSPSQAKEQYLLAAFYYNSLLEEGIKNGQLYYNTGNAFYRTGQIGNAILMYRRALLFSPTDLQIRFNLNQARLLQKNQLSYDGGSDLLQILLFPHNKIPFAWKLWCFIIINIIFWTMLIILRFRKGSLTVSILSGVFALLLVISLTFDYQNISDKHGVIVVESSIGRMGDSINFEASFDTDLFQGVEFTVMERRVGWILVKLDNGDITWIEEKDCGIVEDI